MYAHLLMNLVHGFKPQLAELCLSLAELLDFSLDLLLFHLFAGGCLALFEGLVIELDTVLNVLEARALSDWVRPSLEAGVGDSVLIELDLSRQLADPLCLLLLPLLLLQRHSLLAEVADGGWAVGALRDFFIILFIRAVVDLHLVDHSIEGAQGSVSHRRQWLLLLHSLSIRFHGRGLAPLLHSLLLRPCVNMSQVGSLRQGILLLCVLEEDHILILPGLCWRLALFDRDHPLGLVSLNLGYLEGLVVAFLLEGEVVLVEVAGLGSWWI
mmetsp:Transcript_917/g.1118  ORF Transcript_917/g.1118 Transcript_917/m.1118 type:complete len:269 (-) Transcript_917:1142-1948(-)